MTVKEVLKFQDMDAFNVNEFGILEIKPTEFFANDSLITQTTRHRVYILKINQHSLSVFSIDEGRVMHVGKDEIVSYEKDTDWRECKEWIIMHLLADVYCNRPVAGDYLTIADIANDVFDCISDTFLEQIFDIENNEFLHVLVGEYTGDKNSRCFKFEVKIPYTLYDGDLHDSLFDNLEINNTELALDLLGVNHDRFVQLLLQDIKGVSGYLSTCEPHVKFIEQKCSVELVDDMIYLNLSWYYKFSRIFASKGLVQRALQRIASILEDFIAVKN